MTSEPTALSVRPDGDSREVKGDDVPDVDIRIAGAAAVVTWQRPAALNALTAEMRDALAARMPAFARDPQVYAVIMRSACARAFSAGGDVREIASLAQSDLALALAVTAREYSLNWLLECFSKPTVSLIDGMVVGSGVGVTLYGTHRVAGEGYSFAMPETLLGLFPDVGVAHALARLPDAIGLYLGLTGRRIGRADASALGLVTHCVPAARFREIEAGLMDADPVDPLLDARHEAPGPAPIDAQRRWIAASFSAETLPEVFERLEALVRDGGEGGDFARGVLADLARAAPLSLAVTFRHIREARGLDLRQTLMRDYRLCARFLEGHDFYEGVRALLVDKDRNPRWRPAVLADVTDTMVDRCFAPRPSDELVLATRQEMQAARV
jgi:enoyl-CoA hydratase